MGQVTVVTGGGRGIGAAVARRLAADGHRIAIGYERAKDAADEVAREVRSAGTACLVHQVDTSDEEGVDAFFDAVRAAWDRSPAWSTTPASPDRWAASPTPRWP